jgi:hypothetical protein
VILALLSWPFLLILNQIILLRHGIKERERVRGEFENIISKEN